MERECDKNSYSETPWCGRILSPSTLVLTLMPGAGGGGAGGKGEATLSSCLLSYWNLVWVPQRPKSPGSTKWGSQKAECKWHLLKPLDQAIPNILKIIRHCFFKLKADTVPFLLFPSPLTQFKQVQGPFHSQMSGSSSRSFSPFQPPPGSCD